MAKTTEHNFLTDLRIPYKSYNSAVSTDLSFQDGANVITNVPGYLEARPGFSSQAIPFPGPSNRATGTIKRLFLWHKVSGTTTHYYGMVNSVDNSNSYVYKYEFGVDATASLIHTDSTSITPFDFCTSNQTCYFGKDDVADQMWKYDGTTVTKWGIAAPGTAPTVALAAGSLDIESGWYYRIAYGNSSTGHISSVSDLSACTGIATGKKVQVTVTASSDSQVDKIHIYRSTDGGSTNPEEMQELPNSPVANANATIDDTADDLSLLTVFAPKLKANDPPLPMKGFVVSQNRIWGFTGNKLYYSGFEEIANGVFEECWPSGTDGNYRPYASPIYGLGSLTSGVAIFTAKKIYGVEGDSLDTFRWGTVLDQRGTKSPTCVLSAGGSVVWLDTSGQIWESSMGEMGVDIRTDTKMLVPAQTQMCIYTSGEYNWLVVMDGANTRMLVANLDNKHWMVPWTFAQGFPTLTSITSGETADGTVSLLASSSTGLVYKLVAGTYGDWDAPYYYIPWVKTNLFNVAPQQEPDFVGVVDYIGLEMDSHPPEVVSQLNDDDPRQVASSSFTNITANIQNPPKKANQGTYIVEKQYMSQPTTTNAKRIALYLQWFQAANFKLYSLDVKHHVNK